MNAILYINKTGCQWRMFPSDFAPWQTVYYYFRKWKLEGVFEGVMERNSDGYWRSYSDWTNAHPNFRYCPNVGLCNAFSHGWKTSEGWPSIMNSLLKPRKLWYRLHSFKSCLTNLLNKFKTIFKPIFSLKIWKYRLCYPVNVFLSHVLPVRVLRIRSTGSYAVNLCLRNRT